MKFRYLVSVLVVQWCYQYCEAAAIVNPVLLIPGDGGSKIYGKLSRDTSEYWYCAKNSDWYTMWLNYEAFLDPFIFNCFMDDAQLHFDNQTGTYQNVKGVQTRVDPPRSTNGCDYLDYYHWITYFGKIIEHLKTNRGYNSSNLYGYSYDWRYTPANIHQPGGEFENLRTLTEELFEANNQQRVVLVTHSLGGLITHTFLEQMKQSWKDKYILNWVSIGTPLLGAASAVASFSSGYNLDHPWLVPNFKLRIGLRTWPSTAWLIPYASMWDHQPIVYAKEKKFTAATEDMLQFFEAIEWPMGKMMYSSFRDIVKFKAPGVNISCIYGAGVPTPAAFNYTKGLPDNGEENPTVIFGDGDGTVNLDSGKACLLWNGKNKNTHTVSTRVELRNVEHVDLLTNSKTIQVIDQVLGFNDDVKPIEVKNKKDSPGLDPSTSWWHRFIKNPFSKYVTQDLQSESCYGQIEECLRENKENCVELIQECVNEKADLPEWLADIAKKLHKCSAQSKRRVLSSIFPADFRKKMPMVMKSLPLVEKLNSILEKSNYCF